MKRCDIPSPFDVQLLEELNDKTSPWKQRVANARALEEVYRTGGSFMFEEAAPPDRYESQPVYKKAKEIVDQETVKQRQRKK